MTAGGSGSALRPAHYRLCGLRLGSDFDWPALPPWDGPADSAVDISCRRGAVPSGLRDAEHMAPLFQTSGGDYLLTLPGTGRMLVHDGREITVQPQSDPPAANLGAMLTGPAQAALWHQRGLLPLHSSAVVIRGRAVALCGCGAAGKSTLAAMLAAAGHGVIADDVCVVDTRGGTGPRVLPGSARLQLWADALAELGVAPSGLKRAVADKERYLLDCGSPMSCGPYELAAIVQVVRRHALPPPALERLRGAQAAEAVHDSVHSPRPAAALGRAPAIFAAFLQMAAAGVSVWRLTVPEGLPAVRQAAAKVAALLEV